ncbi:MAG: hypothetical protein WAS25_08155 [Geothrix sp.]|uniref:hypothetical protein n=1 Tax=Geothrix sp. TaxID=1962974 RepID=UPI003BAF53D0
MLTIAIFAVFVGLPFQAQEPAPKPTEAATPTQVAPAPTPPAPPQPAPPASATAATALGPLLDEGLLDPSYFKLDGALFKESKLADFFWAKPDLNLKGRTLKVKWEEPHWLNQDNDKLDLEVGAWFTKLIPEELAKALSATLGESTRLSTGESDLLLTGRIVHINARGSGWSLSKEMMSFDLKILDVRSGDVLLALHHRFFCYAAGIRGKGHDLEPRIPKFAKEFAEFCQASLVH